MELLALFNEMAGDYNRHDDRVYYMDEFDDLMDGITPLEVVGEVATDFNIHHDYFTFNGRHYESMDDADVKNRVHWLMGDYLLELGHHNYMGEVTPDDLEYNNLDEVLGDRPHGGTMQDLMDMYADDYDTLEAFLVRVRVYKCGGYYVGIDLW